jgi:hypothetical protein
MELRTPQLLLELAQTHVSLARRLETWRPLLKHASAGKLAQLERALAAEEAGLRMEDKTYWSPLLKELERLRHGK